MNFFDGIGSALVSPDIPACVGVKDLLRISVGNFSIISSCNLQKSIKLI